MQRDVTDPISFTEKGRFFELLKCDIQVTPGWHKGLEFLNIRLIFQECIGRSIVLLPSVDDVESVARRFDTPSSYLTIFYFADLNMTEHKGDRSLIGDNGKSRTSRIMTIF